VFEIVGYLWLLPSIICLTPLVVFSLAFIFTGNLSGIFALAIILGIFGTGLFLLTKYYQHSRGMLDEEKILPLWFGTLVFNLIFLLPAIYFLASSPMPHYSYNDGQILAFLIYVVPPFWWATAVILSGAAIISELIDQKYL